MTTEKAGIPERDEVEVAELLLLLWRKRYLIALGTFLAAAGGTVYALVAEPVYHAQATIALKEKDKGSGASGVLAQLGGLGGAVASQLGGGGTNLDKLEIILKGHELAERVIQKRALMPLLFPEKWDRSANAWKSEDSADIPSVMAGSLRLRGEHLSVVPELKKGLLKVGIDAPSADLAKEWVEYYLEELNDKIRGDVMDEAKANRAYLEMQMGNTTDPVILEKIQGMIAYEIEKTMLVSSKSFETLEKAIKPLERVKPKRSRILVLAALGGLFASIAWVLAGRFLANLRAKLD